MVRFKAIWQRLTTYFGLGIMYESGEASALNGGGSALKSAAR